MAPRWEGPIYELLSDRPFREVGDPFGFDHLAERLKRLILDSQRSTPFTIGIEAASRRYPLVPRYSKREARLLRRRNAVEHFFSKAKRDYALDENTVRGLARVSLHADLCILALLGVTVIRERAGPLRA
jgi:hypothetical protein